MARLIGDFVGPWSVSALGGDEERGNRFSVATAQSATEIRWYRYSATSGKPIGLHLWDGVTQAQVYSTSTIPDTGAAGWQTHTLSAPVALTAGRMYVVTYEANSGNNFPYVARASAPAPDAGLTYDADARSYGTGGTYPANHDNTLVWGVDVTVGASSGGGGGLTTTDLQNALASWFDPSDATKPTSTPKLYPADLVDTNAKVTAGFNLIGGLQALSNQLADTLQTASDYLAGQPIAGHPSAVHDASGFTVMQAVAGVKTDVDAIVGQVKALLTGPRPSTLIDEADWDGPTTFTADADYWKVTVTTWPEGQGNIDLGAIWLPRAVWCAPIARLGFVEQRQLIDFNRQLIWPLAGRAEALLLYPKAGIAGHVQAFQYT